MLKSHSFHIPVMGIGFSIDTPLKVSPYGIDSVISLADDILIEKVRKMYCEKFGIPYMEIPDKADNFRAKRITSYLNLIKQLAEKKFEELKKSSFEKSVAIREYFNLLPEGFSKKREFKSLTENYLDFDLNKIKSWIKENLSMGSIDVNIMTKLDKVNYKNSEQLPVEYNDAHAALKGYAESDLESSIIFSAGMSPSLYGYLAQFNDFFATAEDIIKKKIVLKVSDYRSALIQGKFLAKKGLWVSEYRIESGLNCGGHAFATNGHLMGPILNEFKIKKEELVQTVHEILIGALQSINRPVPKTRLPIRITAQGGVGTAKEHQLLLDYYKIDSVGWATPFLLVPEVTNVDEKTRTLLMQAKEKDLYLSDTSPLGIPYQSLKGNTKDLKKLELIAMGKPGSPCPKKFLVSNNEFTKKNICTASHQYQKLKISKLNNQDLTPEQRKKEYDKIVDKSCICVGLGTPALLANNLDTKVEGDGVSVCPGPNMAYFSKAMSLTEIIDHIYGRINVITRNDRPNMFIKELSIYIDYLKKKIQDTNLPLSNKEAKYFNNFTENLFDGINYYQDLFSSMKDSFDYKTTNFINQLNSSKKKLCFVNEQITRLPVS